jgi:UDPglucose 6-dehydrogenase
MTSSQSSPLDRIEQSIQYNDPIAGQKVGTTICVVGGGFVGLVTAAGFAQFGHQVVCVENNPVRLAEFREGRLPFFERDLEDLIRSNLQCGRLSFSMDMEAAIDGRRAIFITVGTPPLADGRADMGALHDVIESISRSHQSGQIVVLKSTVAIGTAERVRAIMATNGKGDRPARVISNPEFLREGSAVFDFFHPQRIIIGGDSEEAVEFVKQIYKLGLTHPASIVLTNNATAEMIKYASNVFIATKIGFVNELACLCDSLGIDVLQVAHAMGLDQRIGPDFLSPGPGWGGSCLPKDISEFIGMAEAGGIQLLIAKAVRDANQRQHEFVVSLIKKLTGDLRNKQIGVLGLTFKAGTSDMRGSPAVPIIERISAEGALVRAFDPAVSLEAKTILPGIEIVPQAFDVAVDADCLVILTEWPEFQLLDWQAMAERMRCRNLVDSRNLLNPEAACHYGFKYLSMGQA